MPRGDGTGPAGMGVMTGRAAGYCAGYSVPGYMNYAGGRGLGFGRGFSRAIGRGFGWRSGFFGGAPGFLGFNPYTYAPGAQYRNTDPETEKQALQEQSDALEAEVEKIKKRLSEMNAESAEK